MPATPSLDRKNNGDALTVALLGATIFFFAVSLIVATGGTHYASAQTLFTPLPSMQPPTPQNSTEHTLLISGTASTKAIPDRAIVTFAVETRDTTAAAALAKNSDAMNKVLSALMGVGVQKNETNTAYFNIFPIYNYTQSGNVQSLQGYTVTNSLTVSSARTANVSSWIDAAVQAGANRVDNVQFVFSNEKLAKIQSALIENAIDNARAKADTIAAKIDVHITGVQSIASVDSESVPGPFYAAEAQMESSRTPIVVGGQEVSASVSVLYIIS
ncbi:MAG TPA: SIMPL domain-containing protein [Nitrososphaera sp.]|nr:SIMPL domain-containing protein [Nitrososphaera sp.]